MLGHALVVVFYCYDHLMLRNLGFKGFYSLTRHVQHDSSLILSLYLWSQCVAQRVLSLYYQPFLLCLEYIVKSKLRYIVKIRATYITLDCLFEIVKCWILRFWDLILSKGEYTNIWVDWLRLNCLIQLVTLTVSCLLFVIKSADCEVSQSKTESQGRVLVTISFLLIFLIIAKHVIKFCHLSHSLCFFFIKWRLFLRVKSVATVEVFRHIFSNVR